MVKGWLKFTVALCEPSASRDTKGRCWWIRRLPRSVQSVLRGFRRCTNAWMKRRKVPDESSQWDKVSTITAVVHEHDSDAPDAFLVDSRQIFPQFRHIHRAPHFESVPRDALDAFHDSARRTRQRVILPLQHDAFLHLDDLLVEQFGPLNGQVENAGPLLISNLQKIWNEAEGTILARKYKAEKSFYHESLWWWLMQQVPPCVPAMHSWLRWFPFESIRSMMCQRVGPAGGFDRFPGRKKMKI